MMKYLDYDVRSIFDEFQKAYFDSTGQRLMVGSEEFAISSVFSYALGTLVANMNKVALNRFLDTANGQYLDMIANSLGISRSKEPLLNARFTCAAYGTGVFNQLPRSVDVSGITYNRDDGFIQPKPGMFVVIYKADVPLNRAALDAETLKSILTKNLSYILLPRIEVYGSEYPNGMLLSESGVPMEFPYTPEGDDAFRAYVKSQLGIITGTAAYYESILSNLHPAMQQLYCVRQYDVGYVTGEVNLVTLIRQYNNQYTFPNLDFADAHVALIDIYKHVITDLMTDFVKDPRYHAIGSEIVHSFADIQVCFPHIRAEYDNVYGLVIEDSFEWFPMGIHKHVYTPAQCHYYLMTSYYTTVICRKLGVGVNTSELSAFMLKSVNEIDGMEEWAKTVDTYTSNRVLELMYKNAVNVKPVVTYRVSSTNLNQPAKDIVIKPANALQVLEVPLVTSNTTGSYAVETELVSYV